MIDWLGQMPDQLLWNLSCFPTLFYYKEVWDIEAKSTCHFQIPSAGKDILHEKRPNRDWLN